MNGGMDRRGLALGLLLLAQPALAEGPDYARPGAYLAADFVIGDEEFKQDLEKMSYFQDSYFPFVNQAQQGNSVQFNVSCCSFSTRTNVGFNARAGYRLYPRLALEGEVNWMSHWDMSSEADFNSDRAVPVPFTGDLHVMPLVITANAKFFLLTGRFQPFVSVGSGVYHLKIQDKGLGSRNLQQPQYIQGTTAASEYPPPPAPPLPIPPCQLRPNGSCLPEEFDPRTRYRVAERFDYPCASSSNPYDTGFLSPNSKGELASVYGYNNVNNPNQFRVVDLARDCSGTLPFDVNQWSFVMRFRGGFEYYATENVALQFGVTYVLPTAGRVKDFDYLTYDVFGIEYRF